MSAEEHQNESDEYQEYVASMAEYCMCDGVVCESVLAGGPCKERLRDEPDYDSEPDYTLDDLDWIDAYPEL